MRARARRRAFCFGSCTMNGLTGRSGPVMRCPGARAPPVAAGAGDAGDAGAAGGAGGAAGAAGAARAKGAPRAAGTTGAPTRGAAGGPAGSEVAERVGAGGGRSTGAAGGAGRAAGAGGAGGPGGAGGAGRGATNGPDKRGGAAGVGVGGPGAGGRGRAGGIAPALPAPTAKTVLQTVQRVRTPAAGTLAGSTRYTVSHDGQVTFTPTASLALFRVVVQLRVVPAVDHEHRPWLRLGVALHLGRQLAYLRRMREAAVLIRDDPDRQRHQLHRVPLMTLSIGIVTNQHRRFAHPAQVSELATEMKSYAKTQPGSVFVVDRRHDPELDDDTKER